LAFLIIEAYIGVVPAMLPTLQVVPEKRHDRYSYEWKRQGRKGSSSSLLALSTHRSMILPLLLLLLRVKDEEGGVVEVVVVAYIVRKLVALM
jgi:hypothetical protein